MNMLRKKGLMDIWIRQDIQRWLRNKGVIVLVTLREVDEGDFKFSYQVFEPSSIYYHHPPMSSAAYWNTYE